jgi:hypothetical protein
METNHPHKDPLGIVGKVLGYDSDTNRRFVVKVFSHPSLHEVSVPDKDEPEQVIGESYRYSVEMNFEKAGRKVVTCIVKSTDIVDNQFTMERLRLKILKWLEHTSEESQSAVIDDRRIPWDEDNSCA